MTETLLPPNRILVADIGGSFIRMAAVGTRPGEVGKVRTCPTPTEDIAAFLDSLSVLTAELAGEVDATAPLILAAAGLCNAATGTIRSANIPCLDDKPVCRILSARLQRPVGLLNDADAFALAEAGQGVGRGHRVVFGAILGTGIGGGLVVDGRVVRGRGGLVGEWGHGPVANQLPRTLDRPLPRMRCGCGQEGCADTFGGARGLERLHEMIGFAPAKSHEITDRWRTGDAEAAKTIALWVEMLSEPLALAVNITGASIVATGGGLGRDAALMAELDKGLRKRILSERDEPVLYPGRIDQAALVGGAILGHQMRQSV
ncbi:ROK family protein [Palleronia sp. LCG004]|uniref:ROK family protein n=1 Tax=Palleronia sp. LCG004 TaxID=3079304 RepID=UPI0029431927|nr:ROK family protein [Palleronia sp. LCG004]WOI58307.1 ROK family protein [Palleronia sp. LCG004]